MASGLLPARSVNSFEFILLVVLAVEGLKSILAAWQLQPRGKSAVFLYATVFIIWTVETIGPARAEWKVFQTLLYALAGPGIYSLIRKLSRRPTK